MLSLVSMIKKCGGIVLERTLFFFFSRDGESEVITHMEKLLLNQQWKSLATTTKPAYERFSWPLVGSAAS